MTSVLHHLHWFMLVWVRDKFGCVIASNFIIGEKLAHRCRSFRIIVTRYAPYCHLTLRCQQLRVTTINSNRSILKSSKIHWIWFWWCISFINEFQDIYVLIKLQHLSENAIRLHFIPINLRTMPKIGCITCVLTSITSWNKFVIIFLKKY